MPAHVVTPAASIARAFARASDAASAKATRRAFTPSARSRAALRGRAPSTFRLSGTPAPRVVGRVVVASAAAATPSAGEDADNTAGGVPSWHPDVLDPDQIDGDVPTPGFATIASALEDVAAGKFVVVLDDEDRENEGDLIGAADAMTAESIAFMIKHTSGLLCVAVDDETAGPTEPPAHGHVQRERRRDEDGVHGVVRSRRVDDGHLRGGARGGRSRSSATRRRTRTSSCARGTSSRCGTAREAC